MALATQPLLLGFSSMGQWALTVVFYLLRIYSYLVLLYCIISWFLSPMNKFRMLVNSLVDPMLYPFRVLLSKIFKSGSVVRIDFSPILLILCIELLERLVIILAAKLL